MELVADTNIVAAAIVKDGMTRSLLFRSDLVLHSPAHLSEELERNKDVFIEKSGLSEEAYLQAAEIIVSNVNQIPMREYAHLKERAENISPDRKDWSFFAVAIYLKCPIWSNEKRLKDQNKIAVYNTAEICEMLMP